MTRPDSTNWVTGVLLAAVSLLALGCSQSSEMRISAESPGNTSAQDTTTLTIEQNSVAVPTSVADTVSEPQPTYRTDVTEIAPPESVEADNISFSARIVTDPSRDGMLLLEAQILDGPAGTVLFEIVVNGRARGGSSYAPGVVGVLPLSDETQALVGVRAYDIDKQLLATATLDQALTAEEN